MTELHRGQHPHRPDGYMGGGRYDPVTKRILRGADPREWDDKIELERTYWQEKYAGDLSDGYNPIAQYGGVKGGQTLELHNKLKRQEQQRKAAELAASGQGNKFAATAAHNTAELALSQMSQLQKRQMDKDGDGTLSAAELASNGMGSYSSPGGAAMPRSRDKQPLSSMRSAGQSPPNTSSPTGSVGSTSPSSPPDAFKHLASRYGIRTEEQRQARVNELTTKLGVDKVNLVWQARVDTTPQAGHNTAGGDNYSSARMSRIPPNGL